MSECSGAAMSGVVILEETEGPRGAGARGEGQGAQGQGPSRCGGLWPRQQTWLCVVPLLIGFIGLALSLMLLKWIVVGTVRDYVPTDLMDAKGIEQDPIFLSKPSGVPKNPNTTTTITTTTTVGAGDPASTTHTAARGRNRVGGPTTTTTASPRTGASGSQVTPRYPSGRHGNGGGGGGGRGPLVITPTTATPRSTSGVPASTPSPSPSDPDAQRNATQTWSHEHATTERTATTLAPRTHVHRKTPSPTVPPLRSEHFKPCHEKDLAYCLNDGECFVIETLSGPHKHCKCREGYQGIRCDQFLPKTDSILSDPTDHLGIEFMESKEVYKRQVLSITCIAMGIGLLGTLCMMLYCRNKRRREKLQAQLKESRGLKNYSASSSLHHGLEAKAGPRTNTNLQLHNYCKRFPAPHEGAVCESSLAQCHPATSSHHSRGPMKPHRSSSLSRSPDPKGRGTHWTATRKTQPTPRGRLNPIGGTKHSGPAYQHLKEVETSEREVEEQWSCRQSLRSADGQQDAFLRVQAPVSTETSSWGCRVEAKPGSGEQQGPVQEGVPAATPATSTRSLRHPRSSRASPPPFRSCSIPIIPSVQTNQDDSSCMQTDPGATSRASVHGVSAPRRASKDVGGSPQTGQRASPCSSVVGQQQNEVALLLEEAQEQLRALALAHRKQEESCVMVGTASGPAPLEARETVCFLTQNGGGGAGCLSSNGPTATQLLSPRELHRDSTFVGQ